MYFQKIGIDTRGCPSFNKLVTAPRLLARTTVKGYITVYEGKPTFFSMVFLYLLKHFRPQMYVYIIKIAK